MNDFGKLVYLHQIRLPRSWCTIKTTEPTEITEKGHIYYFPPWANFLLPQRCKDERRLREAWMIYTSRLMGIIRENNAHEPLQTRQYKLRETSLAIFALSAVMNNSPMALFFSVFSVHSVVNECTNSDCLRFLSTKFPQYKQLEINALHNQSTRGSFTKLLTISQFQDKPAKDAKRIFEINNRSF